MTKQKQRAASLGLTITMGWDFDGSVYEIRRNGAVIDTCVALDMWLDGYAKRAAKAVR